MNNIDNVQNGGNGFVAKLVIEAIGQIKELHKESPILAGVAMGALVAVGCVGFGAYIAKGNLGA